MSWEENVNEARDKYLKQKEAAAESEAKKALLKQIRCSYSFGTDIANEANEFRPKLERNAKIVEKLSIMEKIFDSIMKEAEKGKENFVFESQFKLDERHIFVQDQLFRSISYTLIEGIITQKLSDELPNYKVTATARKNRDITMETGKCIYSQYVQYDWSRSGYDKVYDTETVGVSFFVRVTLEKGKNLNKKKNMTDDIFMNRVPTFTTIKHFSEEIDSCISKELYTVIKFFTPLMEKINENTLLDAVIKKYKLFSIEEKKENLIIAKMRLFSNISQNTIEILKKESVFDEKAREEFSRAYNKREQLYFPRLTNPYEYRIYYDSKRKRPSVRKHLLDSHELYLKELKQKEAEYPYVVLEAKESIEDGQHFLYVTFEPQKFKNRAII